MVDSKKVRAPELPPHWKFGEQTGGHFSANPITLLCQLFCVVGFGRPDLEGVWKRSHEDWVELRREVKDRLHHVDIVVRLL